MTPQEAAEAYEYYCRVAATELRQKYPEIGALGAQCKWPYGSLKLLDLIRRLEDIQPRTIIELGTGLTTQVFHLWQKSHDCQVTSIEESGEYFALINEALPCTGIDFVLSNKVIRGNCCWYQWSEQDTRECDMLYIDGPSNDLDGEFLVCLDAQIIKAKHFLFDIRRESVSAFAESPVCNIARQAYDPHMTGKVPDDLIDCSIHHSYFEAE